MNEYMNENMNEYIYEYLNEYMNEKMNKYFDFKPFLCLLKITFNNIKKIFLLLDISMF